MTSGLLATQILSLCYMFELHFCNFFKRLFSHIKYIIFFITSTNNFLNISKASVTHS